MQFFVGSFLIFLVVCFFIIIGSSVRVVTQSTVGVLERLGQYIKTCPAGLTLLVPFIDRLIIVDMKEQVLPLPQQPVITKENVTMDIDAVIYFQVTDPFRATYEVSDLMMAVEKLALTTMRNIIGEMTLDETLASRDVINAKLQHVLDEATGKWGLKVNRVELKDINPPRDIEEAMQKEMRAEREKRSVILLAEGEKQSAILEAEGQKESAILKAEGDKAATILEAEGEKEAAIRNAEGEAQAIREVQQAEAEMIYKVFTAISQANPSKEVLQVKYLEALEKVSDGKSNTLILPFESAAFMGSLAGAIETVKSQSSKPSKN
ncbi:MAG: SPFH/Band 7/PHB domain protein [Vampirovibrio sp.]|nr:SPFH/Band 7/PHB domain protein [Vampirovibrio sp.]